MEDPSDHSTRNRLIGYLSHGERTIPELCSLLCLSENAVRTQLLTLERDGLVRSGGLRKGMRRPAVVFQLTDRAENILAKGYAPVLTAVLGCLRQTLSATDFDQFLRNASREMASSLTGQTREERLEAAVAALTSWGAAVELGRDDSGVATLRASCCAVRESASKERGVCAFVGALLEHIVDRPVEIQCQYVPSPRCAFQWRD